MIKMDQAERGIPARQILTGGACDLDARQVRKALDEEGDRFRASTS